MFCIKVNNIYGIRKSNHFPPIKEIMHISSYMRGLNIYFRKHTCVCILNLLDISEFTNRKHCSFKIVSVVCLIEFDISVKPISCNAERFIISRLYKLEFLYPSNRFIFNWSEQNYVIL